MALFCCSCLTPKYETRTSDKAYHTNQDGNMFYHKHTMEATRSRSLCVCSYPSGRAVNVKLAARLLPPSPSGGGVCLPGEVICFTKKQSRKHTSKNEALPHFAGAARRQVRAAHADHAGVVSAPQHAARCSVYTVSPGSRRCVGLAGASSITSAPGLV